MNTSILTPILGSMLAMAPIVDSTLNFSAELKRPALTENSLVVHEWGTFTALQGSDGAVMNGMQHEEESLPSFVHSRDLLNETFTPPGRPRCPGFCKGFEPGAIYRSGNASDHLTVTQKMETPVLYFYSKNEVKNVRVSVGFPKGVISQYYPAPEKFLPELDRMENLQDGRVDFAFDIAAENTTLAIPPVEARSVYAPSREVAANYIRNTQGEAEKLIFYRGLGNFSTSIAVTSDANGVYIRNTSKNLIMPSGLLFYSDGNDRGGFFSVRSLAPFEVVTFSLAQIEQMKSMYSTNLVDQAKGVLIAQLEVSGLYHDEAVSMVNTWKKSYFKTKGLRLLHVLSQKETEALLPLTMSPQPTELVRTLVGRIEIMTHQEEQELIAQIATQGKQFAVSTLGRLAEPKLRRVRDLVPVGFATDIDRLIDQSLSSQAFVQ